MVRKSVIITSGLLAIYGLFSIDSILLHAADKTWTGSGDGTYWADDDNWTPTVAPTAIDDVLIDSSNASVVCAQTYEAKSLSIGGRNTSTLTSDTFIFGTIAPDSSSAIAVLNRPGGTFKLKGAGTVTLKGQYKDSEETATTEPSFMFWIK